MVTGGRIVGKPAGTVPRADQFSVRLTRSQRRRRKIAGKNTVAVGSGLNENRPVLKN
jgi:hypothetical protein